MDKEVLKFSIISVIILVITTIVTILVVYLFNIKVEDLFITVFIVNIFVLLVIFAIAFVLWE